MDWNYKSPVPSSTGYEDVKSFLKDKETVKKFHNGTPEEQEEIVATAFDIYRSRGIFPITYYNEEGIRKEIEKAIKKEITWEGNVLDFKFNQGQSLCRFLMPNLFDVKSGVKNSISTREKFNDDKYLKKSIDFAYRYKTSGCGPPELRSGLDLTSGGQAATNFKTMNAKALYERYVPEGGFIYDYAAGFGGRLLGALSSKKNFHYIGVEPNTETFKNLERLGSYIEDVTGRTDSFQIINDVSENVYLPEGIIDFAFSSPPYFNLERYTEEETQSYNRYPELDEWLEGYVRPTIKNIHRVLKDGAPYGVNIADFKMGSRLVKFVDAWKRISLEEGFTFEEKIGMKLTNRAGKNNETPKEEGIFIFRK